MTYQELKDRAKELQIDFKGQPSKEELELLVEEAEEAQEMLAKEKGYEKPANTAISAKVDARQNALKLSYVKITPLNERMRGLPSEIYSVGNADIGFIKKVVVFNKASWEPACIIEMLSEKSMVLQENAVVGGQESVQHSEVPAFAIVEVPVPAEMQAALDASKTVTKL